MAPDSESNSDRSDPVQLGNATQPGSDVESQPHGANPNHVLQRVYPRYRAAKVRSASVSSARGNDGKLLSLAVATSRRRVWPGKRRVRNGNARALIGSNWKTTLPLKLCQGNEIEKQKLDDECSRAGSFSSPLTLAPGLLLVDDLEQRSAPVCLHFQGSLGFDLRHVEGVPFWNTAVVNSTATKRGARLSKAG